MFSTYLPVSSLLLSWELPRAGRVSPSWCPRSPERSAVSAWVSRVCVCCPDVIMYRTPFCSQKCLEWNDHPAWHIPVRPHLCLALVQSPNPQLVPKGPCSLSLRGPLPLPHPSDQGWSWVGAFYGGDMFHAKIRISSQCDRQKLCGPLGCGSPAATIPGHVSNDV